MFGYVRYDLPNLYVKDMQLYQAMYCGLCKGIGASCGQFARLGLTYDMTFLSALLHNMTGTDVKIVRQNCFEHAIRKRPIAEADELTQQLGALNTILVYYKLTDDIADGERGRGRRALFRRGFRRAAKRYPKMKELVLGYMREQEAVERAETHSPERAADPTACMLRALSAYLLGEHASEWTDALFYSLGKWIYLIDALDDYDEDVKKGRYNPFVLAYGAKSRAALVREQGEELSFLFDTLFYDLRENLAHIPFHFNRDLTDNVILRGIPLETARVMRGEPRKKTRIRLG